MALVQLKCRRIGQGNHTFWWTSSSKLPNNAYLANERIMHGFVFSEMCPSHYLRFLHGSGIGSIDKKVRTTFADKVEPFIGAEYNDSINKALKEELAADMICQTPGEEEMAINIQTDARHGHRKNAKDCSVLALGEKIHKVLKKKHVTKANDSVSQRHERFGTQKIFEYFDSKGVFIRILIHDMHFSVSVMVKTFYSDSQMQYEKWHGIKGFKK